ncbi:MAG: DNA alkylation repair protein [Patescibacteria group bacterium]|jgi:3-methyladenine DNA glycosylase AlkD
MSNRLVIFKNKLLKKKNNNKSKILSRYFKTGKGEYGEGDIFLGISVVDQRKIIKEFLNLSLLELQDLLNSKFHEFRLSALLILIQKYQLADEKEKKKIVRFYLKNIRNINNWDLVDVSVYKILGHYLFDKDRKIIYKLVRSKNLWARRMAVVATLYFIKKHDLKDIFSLAKILIRDENDLIHKAVGWMLREAGKKDQERLESFLLKEGKKMPRVMLRYAIEKMAEQKRALMLNK